VWQECGVNNYGGVWNENRGGEVKIGVQQIKYKTSPKSDNKNAKGVRVSKYGVQQVTSEEQWCLQANENAKQKEWE